MSVSEKEQEKDPFVVGPMPKGQISDGTELIVSEGNQSFLTVFWNRLIAVLGSIMVIVMALTLTIIVHAIKLFRKINVRIRDPFHNSRQHPLNSPESPRG